MTAATPLRYAVNARGHLLLQVHGLCWSNKAVHLSVISVEVRVQAKILNKPHEVSRVEHKQDRPKDRTLGYSTA